ncbi:hypothetical protein Tco_0212108 [Tanacetum coccineum]
MDRLRNIYSLVLLLRQNQTVTRSVPIDRVTGIICHALRARERLIMMVNCGSAWIMGPNQNPPTGAVDFTLDDVLDKVVDDGGIFETPKDFLAKLGSAGKTMLMGETGTRPLKRRVELGLEDVGDGDDPTFHLRLSRCILHFTSPMYVEPVVVMWFVFPVVIADVSFEKEIAAF